MLISVLSGI